MYKIRTKYCPAAASKRNIAVLELRILHVNKYFFNIKVRSAGSPVFGNLEIKKIQNGGARSNRFF